MAWFESFDDRLGSLPSSTENKLLRLALWTVVIAVRVISYPLWLIGAAVAGLTSGVAEAVREDWQPDPSSNRPFPRAMTIKFAALDDLIYPLMLHVCRPRGIEDTQVGVLFDSRCAACGMELGAAQLLEVAGMLAHGLDARQAAIPATCPACGSETLDIALTDFSDEEQRRLQSDKFFARLTSEVR